MSDRWAYGLMPDLTEQDLDDQDLDGSDPILFGSGNSFPGPAERQSFGFHAIPIGPPWPTFAAPPYSPMMQQQQQPFSTLATGAPSGQHTTPYSSYPTTVYSNPPPPSVHTDLTSTSDPFSAGVSNTQHLLPNYEEKVLVDPHPQVHPLEGIDERYPNQDIPQELPANLKAPRNGNSQNVVPPTPNPVPPESASQRMPTPPRMGVQSQELDDTLALAQGTISRLLAQNPNHQSLSPISQGRLDSIRGEITEYFVVSRRREMPPPDSPSDKESGDKKTVLKSQLYYRCPRPKCTMKGPNKAVFKRHVDSKHFPQWEYYCHHKELGCPVAVKPLYRRDKLVEHYKNHLERSTDELGVIIDKNRVLRPCERVCICGRSVNDWEEFYECFLKHCECEPPLDDPGSSSPEHRRKRRRDDSNDDPFDPSTGNGGPALSKQGHGRSGNVNGRGQHQSFSGATGNQLRNGDSKPFLRARSASDSCDGRTKGSQPSRANDAAPPTSKSKPSGSGNDQSGRSKKKSARPPLDLRNLQSQAGSQSSVNNCKTCHHVFNICSTCCESPPSADRCHMCPPLERTLAVQAGNPHADLALRQALLTGQNVGFADHLQFTPQGIHAGPSIPTTVDPALLTAMDQQHWQVNQARQPYAQAQGVIPRGSNQQRLFGGNQPYMAGAVHDIQVRGMSEPEMEFSILDSKRKWDSKKSQDSSSSTWSVILPFRSSPPPRPVSPLPLCKPLTGTGSISVGGMEIIAREFIGPLSLKAPSSGCRCPCRTRPSAMYFARGRVDIAPGRKIEMDFTMARETHNTEARGMGHPLRTRIQVVVKMLRLRTAAKSASDKHKKEASAAFKGAREATVCGSDATTTTGQDDAKVVARDNSGYDWEVESVAESTFTVYTQASAYTDITVPSAPSSPRPPSLIFSRTSSCTDLTLPSRPSSPGFSGYPRNSSCADLRLPAPARSRSPLRWILDDDTLGNEELPIQDVGLFEKEGEEKEIDLGLGSGLQSLDRLSRGRGGVPADELRSGVGSAWDYDRISQYVMGLSLSHIFSRASRGNGFNSSWDKKPSS
ncbi:uncharacterized protein N7496_004881 [Penicillium cataractarum]|uniref:C2H2-type domain-containing protein n=1 Tax=Penicillium cataractarum TaxID=2100454 RepID=A0A9W9VD11_9EURO|nr:uncharacterized protein N7496_004881 [Penicillium cataractarum]KAJ5377472.1 hypothetical protein N7496_004881 [Penicillium cataractarum]